MEPESEIITAAPEDEPVSKGKEKMDEEDQKDDNFEFGFQFATFPASPVPADVVFLEWKMKQLFPVRSSDEIMQVTETATEEVASNVGRSGRSGGRKPLGELMSVEKELAFPSDADETEAVAVGAYCVWKPPAERKSKKTRPSKRTRPSKKTLSWKMWCRLRDLLRRGSGVHGEDGVGRRR